MNDSREHEKFEMEVLSLLQSQKILETLVFGGGTMLRLCFELPRYSVDLDFSFKEKIDPEKKSKVHKKISALLRQYYDITDIHEKKYTYLYEFRSSKYPQRMKIELRKEAFPDAEMEKNIAFSPFSTLQIQLDTFSLSQMAKNKIEAFLERNELRDVFDLEWIARRDPDILQICDRRKLYLIKEKIHKFSAREIQLRLGVLLEAKERNFYRENKFLWLERKIESVLEAKFA